ncbi:MAG: L-threonylcarbamoyladenylate synthase [Candidatus Aenigmatarchaeota archaeon]
MKRFKMDDVIKNKDVRNDVIEEIRTGSVFVYPTDTVYGLGCNALISDSVKKIRKIKKTEHPFSVIVPSSEWILKNLVVESKKSLNVLPGPYTLIFRKKEPFFLKDVSPLPTLGVRIPAHPITKLVRDMGIPVVSTSANISGSQPIKKASDANRLKGIDFVIDGGTLPGPPSIVIDLSGEEEKVIRGELRYKKSNK